MKKIIIYILFIPSVIAANGIQEQTELIIKSGLDEYPGLAVNEYVCMAAAKKCGLNDDQV